MAIARHAKAMEWHLFGLTIKNGCAHKYNGKNDGESIS